MRTSHLSNPVSETGVFGQPVKENVVAAADASPRECPPDMSSCE